MNKHVDPIIEELHETRREISRRFAYDVHQISQDAQRRQKLEVGRYGNEIGEQGNAPERRWHGFRQWAVNSRRRVILVVRRSKVAP